MTVVEDTMFLIPPDGGMSIWTGPIGTTVKVPSTMTGGLLSICEMPVAAGFMVPPHTHHDTDEWSFVLEGHIGARIGTDEFTAGPGSWVLKPRGLMHTFWNAGPGDARIIELLTPGRFEEFFRRMSDLASRNELTDAIMDGLAAEYATTVSMEWVGDLRARFGLEVTL